MKCELVLTSGTSCEKDAVYTIKDSNRFDPDVYPLRSCPEHLVDMLGTSDGYPTCTEWTVSLIGEKQ